MAYIVGKGKVEVGGLMSFSREREKKRPKKVELLVEMRDKEKWGGWDGMDLF